MTILVFTLLAVFCFLYVLNLLLRGTKKELIGIILGILIVTSVILSFFLSKWWFGIIAFFSMFLLIGIFRPFAQALASKLLGYRVSIDEQATYSVDSLIQTIHAGKWDEAMQMVNKENNSNRKRLLKIYSKQKIQSLTNEYNMTFDDFYDLFMNLKVIMPDIIWDIFSSKNEIRDLIELRKINATDNEIIKHFRYDKI